MHRALGVLLGTNAVSVAATTNSQHCQPMPEVRHKGQHSPCKSKLGFITRGPSDFHVAEAQSHFILVMDMIFRALRSMAT